MGMRLIGVLCAGFTVAVPAVARAAEDAKPMTVGALEAGGAHAMNARELSRLIRHRRVEFTAIDGGARETVVYGRRRVDANGRASDYEIGDSGLIEALLDGERALSFYRYHKLVYACIDLECPYLVTSAPSGKADGTNRTQP